MHTSRDCIVHLGVYIRSMLVCSLAWTKKIMSALKHFLQSDAAADIHIFRRQFFFFVGPLSSSRWRLLFESGVYFFGKSADIECADNIQLS